MTKKREFWLLLGLALVLGARIGMLGNRVWQTTRFPYQFDPTEGIILSEVRLLAEGQSIYAPFTPERFISGPYPPLYYAALVAPMKLFGPSFTWGRLAALVAAVAVAGIMGGMTARRSGRWWGMLPAGLWLASVPLLVWANRLKPDLWAIAFSLGAIAVLDRNPRRLGWAAILCALAGYSKQSALAAPAAITLWLLLEHRDVFWRWLAWATLAGAGPFLVLDALTNHGFFIHMIDFHALPWSARRWLTMLGEMAWFHAGLAGLTVAFVVWRGRASTERLVAIYAVLTAVASFSGGTFGGFHNHLLEFLAAICLGAGLTVAALASFRTRWLNGALALLLLQILLWWRTPAWLAWELDNLPTAERRQRMDLLAQLVAATPGPVWSSDLGLLTTTGKPIEFNDPLIMSQAAQLGWWDETEFVSRIRRREYDLILWHSDFEASGRPNDLSPAVFESFRSAYQVKYRDMHIVYEPRDP